eukprot:TRINITY_DN80915_c0_g1_i1.p1 TRINITY_DN80915_c0_g1~~TRINITY_DN80915_c0_g1_i1.p1  ORF type:complete len:190 (+),score=54.03 TRINITY_DN80915_c0_g1_i1:84-653(+)
MALATASSSTAFLAPLEGAPHVHKLQRPQLAQQRVEAPAAGYGHPLPAAVGVLLGLGGAALARRGERTVPHARGKLIVRACFKVGEKVECKDADEEEWKQGRVVNLEPLQVLPDYFENPYEFDEVRKLEDSDDGEDIYEEGARVQVRDNEDEEWKNGTVVSLSPLKVLADYYESPFIFNEVRPLPEGEE